MVEPGTAFGVPFTDAETASALKLFETLPSYKDGSISTTEMPELFRQLQWQRTPAHLIFGIDSINRISEDGRLEVELFRRYLLAHHEPALIMREWAISCDKDKDGFIDAEEYKLLYEWLPEHVPGARVPPFRQFLEEADTTKDGKVSIEEFTAYFMKGKK